MYCMENWSLFLIYGVTLALHKCVLKRNWFLSSILNVRGCFHFAEPCNEPAYNKSHLPVISHPHEFGTHLKFTPIEVHMGIELIISHLRVWLFPFYLFIYSFEVNYELLVLSIQRWSTVWLEWRFSCPVYTSMIVWYELLRLMNSGPNKGFWEYLSTLCTSKVEQATWTLL